MKQLATYLVHGSFGSKAILRTQPHTHPAECFTWTTEVAGRNGESIAFRTSGLYRKETGSFECIAFFVSTDHFSGPGTAISRVCVCVFFDTLEERRGEKRGKRKKCRRESVSGIVAARLWRGKAGTGRNRAAERGTGEGEAD